MARRSGAGPRRRGGDAGTECDHVAGEALTFDIQQELLTCLPDMQAFARFLAKDSSRADDLVQDASVRVLAAAGQFEPGTNFKAWVFTILRNLYYNELQKSRRLVSQSDDGDGLDLVVARAATQEASLDFRDFYRNFWDLDERHREVLMLVGASGLSYDEAAVICGCSVGTIKSRVSRARRALKDKATAGGPHGVAPSQAPSRSAP